MARINFSDCSANRMLNNRSIMETGAQFTVVCKRCERAFDVIRNFGGGIRNHSNQNINPAKCPSCGSMSLELY
jgi:DNA-directed RNA polymerase subunit RPC12/RpoP